MPAVTITVDDLRIFAPQIEEVKAEAMIEDAVATAAVVAPCILTDEFAHPGAAKAILRAAILRWNDAGSGAVVSQTAGPFGQTVDTSNPRRSLFWPSEIERLQKLCNADESKAFAVDTVPTVGPIEHADICAINFGATYCSCGALLTGLSALWEQP
ncbi:hypothetical protein [Cellulomonas sp. NPDC058312]|uniref:hypothetical protein n=1 Tax=Cellulomonas sp. NPDC058312 TaxID=3346441 RepID=UPI0036E8B8BF